MNPRIYPIADLHHVPEALRSRCSPGWIHKIRAVRTGEFRTPKKGEWYLSGADPQAWYAPNDLGIEFHILRLVIIEMVPRIVEDVP